MNAPHTIAETALPAPARAAMGQSHIHESARAQVAGDAHYIDERFTWYRFDEKRAVGPSPTMLANNLTALRKTLDKALQQILPASSSFHDQAQIRIDWQEQYSFASMLAEELDPRHTRFPWLLQEAFGNHEISVFEAANRAIKATVYLRECARALAAQLVLPERRRDLAPKARFVLSLVVLLEWRAGRRATVSVYGEPLQRRSDAASFVRSILEAADRWLRGEFPAEVQDRATGLQQGLALMEDRDALREDLADLLRPGRLENLVDDLSAGDSEIRQRADEIRAIIFEQLEQRKAAV